MAGMKAKSVLKILGVLTLAAGALPLLKPYVPQLAVVPTEGMLLPVVVVILGVLGIYMGFTKAAY